MLSVDVFHAQFVRFLCQHFRKELTPEISAAYFESFETFSNETFTQLCKLAFAECERMPPPKWFHDRATQLAELDRRKTHLRALPNADNRNVVYISQEQQLANLHRLRSMMRNVGRMPNAATRTRDS